MLPHPFPPPVCLSTHPSPSLCPGAQVSHCPVGVSQTVLPRSDSERKVFTKISTDLPNYSRDPSYFHLPPLFHHKDQKGPEAQSPLVPVASPFDILSFVSLKMWPGGPLGRILEITGAAKVTRQGRGANQDETFSAVCVWTLLLSARLSLRLFRYLVYLTSDQPNPHLEEDAHPPNSMPCLGQALSPPKGEGLAFSLRRMC